MHTLLSSIQCWQVNDQGKNIELEQKQLANCEFASVQREVCDAVNTSANAPSERRASTIYSHNNARSQLFTASLSIFPGVMLFLAKCPPAIVISFAVLYFTGLRRIIL